MPARITDPIPGLRSPTRVEGGYSAKPWIVQKQLYSTGAPYPVEAPRQFMLKEVAVMSEPELDSKLIIRLGDHEEASLPLLYLSHLWPRTLELPVFIHGGPFAPFALNLELVGVPVALIILLGIEHAP